MTCVDNVCTRECTSALVIIRSSFDFKVLKTNLFLFPRRVLYQINSWRRFRRPVLSTSPESGLMESGEFALCFFHESGLPRSCLLSLSEPPLIGHRVAQSHSGNDCVLQHLKEHGMNDGTATVDNQYSRYHVMTRPWRPFQIAVR